MYGHAFRIELASELLTHVACAISNLFMSLRDYNVVKARGFGQIDSSDFEKLGDCATVKELFVRALENDRWVSDNVKDQKVAEKISY